MRKMILSKFRISISAVIMTMALLYLYLAPMPVYAAENFNFYTNNPGIHVTAGDSISFYLYLTGSNAADSDINLFVTSIPDGFIGLIFL